MTGPFTAVVFAITPDMAALWTLLFWLGSNVVGPAGTGGVSLIFTVCFCMFALGTRRHLRVDEDDLTTVLKACCCPCFLVGQLGATTRVQLATGTLVGPPVTLGASSDLAGSYGAAGSLAPSAPPPNV